MVFFYKSSFFLQIICISPKKLYLCALKIFWQELHLLFVTVIPACNTLNIVSVRHKWLRCFVTRTIFIALPALQMAYSGGK